MEEHPSADIATPPAGIASDKQKELPAKASPYKWSAGTRLRDEMLAAAVAVVSAACVFYHLGFSVWYDEAASWALATLPPRVLLRQYLWGTEANMSLYYGFLQVWLSLTHAAGLAPTEVILRLPSAFCAVVASVL